MLEYILLNDGDPADEAVLGATVIFESIEEAEFECEHWVSEQPGMRFYNIRGERLRAIDHGDWKSFHFEKTGTFFEGFEDLIRREAERRGIAVPETGYSIEHVLQMLWERERTLRDEHRSCLAWLRPPRSFRKKHGYWAWFLPFLRKEPSDS